MKKPTLAAAVAWLVNSGVKWRFIAMATEYLHNKSLTFMDSD